MSSIHEKKNFEGGLDRDTDNRLLAEGDYYYGLNIRNQSSEGRAMGVVENIPGTSKVSYTFPTGAPNVQYSSNDSSTSGGGASVPKSTIQMIPNDVSGSGMTGLNDFNIEVAAPKSARGSAHAYNFAQAGKADFDTLDNISASFSKFHEAYASQIKAAQNIQVNYISQSAIINNVAVPALAFVSLDADKEDNVQIGISGSNVGNQIVSGSNLFINNLNNNQAPLAEFATAQYDCIGQYEDTITDRIYYFVSSNNNIHHILEYDLQTNTINLVFRDVGSFQKNAFRWKNKFLISDINKVGDVLYFNSDRYGEPQRINVEKSKASMAVLDNTGYTAASQVILDGDLSKYYPYAFFSLDLTYDEKKRYVETKRRPSLEKPSYEYQTESGVKKNNLYGNLFQFRTRNHFYDKEVSEWSPISDVVIPDAMKSNLSNMSQAAQSIDNKIKVTFEFEHGDVEFIEVCALKCTDFDNVKKGNRGEFFTIAKIDNIYNADNLAGAATNTGSITFYNDKIYPFIDKKDGAKLYDNVPKKARTQAVLTDNRVAYGNYLEGFDLPNINVELTPKYGEIGESTETLLLPYWSVAQDSTGSTVNQQKENAYSGTSGQQFSQLFTNSGPTINATGGSFASGASKTFKIASIPELEIGGTSSNHVVLGPYKANGKIPGGFGPNTMGGYLANYNFGNNRDYESWRMNRLVNPLVDNTPGGAGLGFDSLPLYCGAQTGTVDDFPAITFVFNYSNIPFQPNQDFVINIQSDFKVRVASTGNLTVRDKANDSNTHNVDINMNISTANSATPLTTIDEQMIYLASELSSLYTGYATTASKPEGSPGWHYAPFVDANSQRLVIPWISANKNTFNDPDDASGNGLPDGDRTYRLISLEEGGGTGEDEADWVTQIQGVSLNFNFPNSSNNDDLLTSANKSNIASLQVFGSSSQDNPSTFKSGAFHDFGLIYYDGKGRCSTVAIDDKTGSTKTYVEFPPERIGSASINSGQANNFGISNIDWQINHQAPSWAKYWRWAYSKNTSVDEFIQFICPKAVTSEFPAAGELRLFLSLASLKGADDSYRSQHNPLVDYSFVEGDRIRFIKSPWLIGGEGDLGAYIDVKISGFDLYDGTAAAAGGPVIGEIGYFITIDEIADVSGASYTEVSTSVDNFFRDCLFEIYRPVKESSVEESKVYYEYGPLYEVSPEGEHTPSSGTFTEGDVYYKKRLMRNNSTSVPFHTMQFVEDYYLNDFYETNHISIGRPNVYSPYAREEVKESSVTFSEPYQPDVNYNGLSTFELFNYSDLKKDEGSIQKLHSRDTDLIALQEDRVFKVPVNKDIITNADGSSNVGLSANVLGTPVPYAAPFGISKNPESFVHDGNVLYWIDIKRGTVCRLSRDGVTAISDVKMADFFRDKSEQYNSSNPTHAYTNNIAEWSDETPFIDSQGDLVTQFDPKHYNFRILGGFNSKHNEYVVTFPQISIEGSDWENILPLWDSEMASWDLFSPSDTITVPSETIGWNERSNRWSSFFSFVPEMYGKINKRFVSWLDGQLWIHDFDASNYNTFYGTTHDTKLYFTFNGAPHLVKTYHALSVDGTQTFESDSAGVEETVKTGFDVKLNTNLSSTAIMRENMDKKEGIQYAQIPFSTTGPDPAGSELFGIGVHDTDVGSATITEAGAAFTTLNLLVGDQIYYHDGTNHILIGTISAVTSDTVITLTANATVTLVDTFIYVMRSGFAEGDRMKGNFMESELTKTTKQKVEIFSVKANMSSSELSDK